MKKNREKMAKEKEKEKKKIVKKKNMAQRTSLNGWLVQHKRTTMSKLYAKIRKMG